MLRRLIIGAAQASRPRNVRPVVWIRSFADLPKKKKILIPTRLDSIAAEILESKGLFEVIQAPGASFDDLAKDHSDAYGIIVRSEKVAGGLLPKFPNLKIVVRAGAGYNTIDTKACRRRGVDVMNTPGANANAVAEEVIAMILASYRSVIQADASTREGKWEKNKFMGKELTHKTVGIVGLGNIGQLIVKRLKGFECKILASDPMVSDSKAASLGAEMVSVETLFAESDIVTLHVPSLPSTIGMVNDNLLGSMKEGSVIINCARDGIVDIEALAKHKENKKLVYCTDVYAKDEPGMKPIAPLADIMLPHLGANTEEANFNAAKRAAAQLVEYDEKHVSAFIVNRAIPADLDPTFQRLAFYMARTAQGFLGQELQTQMIDVTFHGRLKKFGKYLAPQVVLGLRNEFDATFDQLEAQKYLEGRGIQLTVNEADDDLYSEGAITIDVVKSSEEEQNKYQRVSVRGTLAEGVPMISRINQYNNTYFTPVGHCLLVEYNDAPGMLAVITSILARHTININDIRAPRNADGSRTLAILLLDKECPSKLLVEIKSALDAHRVCHLDIDSVESKQKQILGTSS